jgi:hypothetical protein
MMGEVVRGLLMLLFGLEGFVTGRRGGSAPFGSRARLESALSTEDSGLS